MPDTATRMAGACVADALRIVRQDDMELDQLLALAITDDHAARERVLNSAPASNHYPNGLRRLPLGREIDAATDPVAKLVGIPAYSGPSSRRSLCRKAVARPNVLLNGKLRPTIGKPHLSTVFARLIVPVAKAVTC